MIATKGVISKVDKKKVRKRNGSKTLVRCFKSEIFTGKISIEVKSWLISVSY